MTDRLRIAPRHHRILEALLRQHLPGIEVWAYGSRVNGRGHTGSDLDLVLRGLDRQELPAGQLLDFEDAIRESTIPFLVEVHDWARLPKRFHREIERDYVVMSDNPAPGPNGRGSGDGISGETIDRASGRWSERLFGDLTENFDAVRVPVKRAERVEGPYPYYGASGVVDHVSDYLLDGEYLLVAEDGENLRTRSTPIAFLAAGKFWVNNHAHVVRGNQNADTRFLMYALSRLDISGYLTGSTMPKLTQDSMNRICLLTPPLDDQRAIAHILGTLDDKIELNRRMNATLEALARALFRSWFVDFDPVRAKMEGRDTGLPKEIADLFPDRLVDSELGKMPEGWTVGTLGDVAAAPRSGIDPGRVADDTPYIGLEHMPRRSVALTDWGRAGSVSSTKTAFENRDMLFGKLRPYFHKVGIAPVNGVCSTDIVVLRARMPEWSAFVLACISSSGFVGYASQTSTGTKMPRTSWRTMSRYEMCRPAVAVAAAFQHVVSPMFERIVANVHESRTLGRLRDALLPKLVSGELRVDGLEQATGSVDNPAPVGMHGA